MLSNIPLLIFMEAILIAGTMLFRFCLKRSARPMLKPLYIGLVLIIPVAGLFLLNYNNFYLFLIFLPALAARGKRVDLACIYLALLPQFPELGQTYTLGSIYFGTVSAITMLNLGAIVGLLTVRGRERKIPGGLELCAWGFFFMLLFSQIRGLEPNGVMRMIQAYFLIFMPPYLLLSRTLRSREDIEQAMLVFTWSVMLAASVAIFESIRGWPLYQAFYGTLHVPMAGQGLSATLAIRSGFLRAQGPICNATALGVLLMIGALFAPGLKRFFTKPQVWAIYGTMVLGLIFTQSRGAWIGCAAGYMVRLLFQRRFGLASGVIALALFGWAATGILASEGGQFNQMIGKSGDAQMTAEYRSNLLQRGIQEVTKYPIQGQTPAQLQISMDDMRQGEGIIDFVNSHLYIALVLGIEGLLIWLTLWFYPFIAAFGAQDKARRRKVVLPLEIPSSALIACFVALMFTSPIDRNPSLLAITLGFNAALVRLARRNPAAKSDRAKEAKPIFAPQRGIGELRPV